MTLTYAFMLVIVLSTKPGYNEVLMYQFPTWDACTAKKAELVEGMKGKRRQEDVTVDCRRNLTIDFGGAKGGA